MFFIIEFDYTTNFFFSLESSYKKYEFGKPELERKYEENKDVLEEN